MVLKLKIMKHQYHVTGLTCSKCEVKVKSALLALPFVNAVQVSKETNSASVTMDKHITLAELNTAVAAAGNYTISENFQNEEIKNSTWLITYSPLLLIFGYIVTITLFIQLSKDHFDLMVWMRHFMAGFFLTFSFFKLLNLKGFADSYRMYDIVAMKIPAWAYLYPFVELTLGLAYLVNFEQLFTNLTTLVVMSISIVGVIKSVVNKSKIRCACLGAVFNLPMTTVTIVEDAIMILMSAMMLILTF